MCKVLGGVLVIVGLFYAIQYVIKAPFKTFASNGFVVGFVLVLLGATLILKAELLIPFIPYAMGFMIAVNGIRSLQNAIDVWKLKLSKPWIVVLIGIINLVFGIVMMVNPGLTIEIMMKAVGIGLIVSGIADLITILIVLGYSKKEEKKSNENIIDVEVND